MTYVTCSRACVQNNATAFIEGQQHHNRGEGTVCIFLDVCKRSLSEHNCRLHLCRRVLLAYHKSSLSLLTVTTLIQATTCAQGHFISLRPQTYNSPRGTVDTYTNVAYLFPNLVTPSVCIFPLSGKAPKSNALTVCSAGSALVIGISTATEVVCEVGELKGAIAEQKQEQTTRPSVTVPVLIEGRSVSGSLEGWYILTDAMDQ